MSCRMIPEDFRCQLRGNQYHAVRSIFLFLTSFIFFSSCDTTLECSVTVCVSTTYLLPSEFHLNAILISEDDKTEQSIDFKKKDSVIINNLKPGNYQITYFNRFGELISVFFTLNERIETTRIRLFDDRIDLKAYLEKRRIDKLKNGDCLKIELKRSGCFSFSEETAVFYKERDELFATNLIDTFALDSEQIGQIRKFETELGYARDNVCTIYDTYRIFLNNAEVLLVEDNSCTWDGFHEYLISFFEKEVE